MSDQPALYRTIVRGMLQQRSALSVGGSQPDITTGEICYRDGQGRLTMPGTGLAGALLETSARIFSDLIPAVGAGKTSDTQEARHWGDMISGKRRTRPSASGRNAPKGKFLQSVWLLRNSHPAGGETVSTEWRQGVGIRQATGATAREKRALYDFEVVPRGTGWPFLLEIDTFRGGAQAEAIALIALNEWVQGRAWLGRSAARGTGWVRLIEVEVVRLPLTRETVSCWPDNTRDELELLQDMKDKNLATCTEWTAAITEAEENTGDLARTDWHYLTLDICLAPGLKAAVYGTHAGCGYGYDVLQTSGHPLNTLNAFDDLSRFLRPASAKEPTGTDMPAWLCKSSRPDSPFVSTRPNGSSVSQPYIPGSGVRGPLRHAASSIQRGIAETIRDPNFKADPLAEQLRQALAKSPEGLRDDEIRQLTEVDVVTDLFGAEELCSRILVSDAELCSEGQSRATTPAQQVQGPGHQLAVVHHHAEDEFTAGAYGSGKFDRHVLIRGAMQFQIVAELPSRTDLTKVTEVLCPALRLAQLGHLPIGGGKWRGSGWVPWVVNRIELAKAGKSEAESVCEGGDKDHLKELEQWQ